MSGDSALGQFLSALRRDGRVAVGAAIPGTGEPGVSRELEAMDRAARMWLGPAAPALVMVAAEWGARVLYQLCQCTVYRDISPQRVVQAVAESCPAPRGPDTDWSVDLTFRHLPRLFRWARGLSPSDPLVEAMRHLAGQWPLSSVGLPGVELELGSLDSFLHHPALRRLYADRIVAESDVSRLNDARVKSGLEADFGIYRELAPVTLRTALGWSV